MLRYHIFILYQIIDKVYVYFIILFLLATILGKKLVCKYVFDGNTFVGIFFQ